MMEGWEKKGHLYSSKSEGPEMSVCRVQRNVPVLFSTLKCQFAEKKLN